MPRSKPATLLSLACAVPLLLAACGPGDEVEITLVRQAPAEASTVLPDASSRERFGGGPGPAHDHAAVAGTRFVWEMPAGWVELPPQQFRDVNLRPGGHPELQCYLTILQGDGGGLTANVNRWRGQLGLDPITDAEAAALPTGALLGRPAVRVELASEGEDAQALLGSILVDGGSMATVKMTGPVELVAQERAAFERFCETLAVRDDVPARPAPGARPTGGPGASGGLTYELPDGWSDAGASSMRLVNLVTPGSSQCYVIRLVGEAGGLAANLNRWRGEVGLEPLEQAELEALPEVEVLGQPCGLLEVSGEYRGMGSQAGPGKTLLGVALIGGESSLFVKMVGDEDDVAAERQRFIEFLGSLSER